MTEFDRQSILRLNGNCSSHPWAGNNRSIAFRHLHRNDNSCRLQKLSAEKPEAQRRAELKFQLEVGEAQEVVNIEGGAAQLQIATEGRIADTLDKRKVSELPIPQRDVFALTKLSAGASFVPSAATSTKLTSSPVVTVNGNRYRGNNYVLDGAMNSNSNNSGEPTIVPSIESIEEVQVQTNNFSSEFGRGNGAVINLRTKTGTNQFHGRLWEFHRNAALNASNFFATSNPPLVFNQFGGNIGGPIFKDKTFFFGNYEGMRNAAGRAASFQVETPELRAYVNRVAPNSIANQLFTQFGAPSPQQPRSCATDAEKNSNNCRRIENGNFIPTNGTLFTTINDYIRFNQFLGRVDHSMNGGKDKIYGRYIFENQADNSGGASGSVAQQGLGRVMRGMKGAFEGKFSNTNLGYTKVLNRSVNDIRFAFQTIYTNRGNDDAIAPQITVTGFTAGWGDFFNSATEIRTYEARDVLTLDRGRHALRVGGEFRRLFKGLSIAPPDAGSFLSALMWSPKLGVNNRALSQIANGWQVGTIITKQSGRPFQSGMAPRQQTEGIIILTAAAQWAADFMIARMRPRRV
jgi:hypothetical protein